MASFFSEVKHSSLVAKLVDYGRKKFYKFVDQEEGQARGDHDVGQGPERR
jgi:hypothetical protein